MKTVGWMLAIAATYLLTGKLGLLLAIPPGYATAVWPPSGIALGALLLLGPRFWPGVWLGSFLTNVWTSFDSSSGGAIFQSLMLASAIGGGAALQAVVGVWLIRRFVGTPTLLVQEREIFSFLLLAGPLASLVNATVGIGSLWAAGRVPLAGVPYNWWTWWVGDTIGASIFAPLMLMWFGGAAWERRRDVVTLSLAITFVAAVSVFIYTSHLEQQQLEQHFREDANGVTNAVQRRLDLNIELLRSIGGLFAASENVEREEFRAFANTMLVERADLQAVEWAPRISAERRAAFEASIAPLQRQNLGIFERDAGATAAARERTEYFPIEYLEPADNKKSVLGFDVASEKTRRSALERARDSGRIAITAPLNLLQAEDSHDGFLIVLPIYAALSDRATVIERREKLRGFAATAIRASRLVGVALAEQTDANRPYVQIKDAGAGDRADRTVFFNNAPKDQANAGSRRPSFQYDTTLEIAGRIWALEFRPSLEYLTHHTSLLSWMVLAVGMLFSAMVGAGALVITGRTAAVAALVSERTNELAHANERLEQANRVKSEFISTVSHELRTPLTSIRGSLGLINGGAAGVLPDKAQYLLQIAYRNTDRLILLINDILDVERIDSDRLSLDLSTHLLSPLIDQAVESNRGYAQNCNVRFVLHMPLTSVTVKVDANRLLQVMANFLSNAAKFSPPHSVVEIIVSSDERRCRVAVKDRGPGIPQDFQPRIFQRFSQADSSDSRTKGGTGLGLAISKALIEQMGGVIGYDTVPGGGTTFYFELPVYEAVEFRQETAVKS